MVWNHHIFTVVVDDVDFEMNMMNNISMNEQPLIAKKILR